MNCVPKFSWNPEINAEWQELELRIERLENGIRDFRTFLRLPPPIIPNKDEPIAWPLPSDVNLTADDPRELNPNLSNVPKLIPSFPKPLAAQPAKEEEAEYDQYAFKATLRRKKAAATQKQERRFEIQRIRRTTGVCELCGKGLDKFARLLRQSSHLECTEFQEPSLSDGVSPGCLESEVAINRRI